MKYELPIPPEHHKFILGKGGNNLKQLEANTGTHITIPKNGMGMVTVVGIKEDVEKACHEIQVISDRKVIFDNLMSFHLPHNFGRKLLKSNCKCCSVLLE